MFSDESLHHNKHDINFWSYHFLPTPMYSVSIKYSNYYSLRDNEFPKKILIIIEKACNLTINCTENQPKNWQKSSFLLDSFVKDWWCYPSDTLSNKPLLSVTRNINTHGFAAYFVNRFLSFCYKYLGLSQTIDEILIEGRNTHYYMYTNKICFDLMHQIVLNVFHWFASFKK